MQIVFLSKYSRRNNGERRVELGIGCRLFVELLHKSGNYLVKG